MDTPITPLGQALPAQCARVRAILGHCQEIGPAGQPLAFLIEQSLKAADAAMVSGDVVAMVGAYEDLKGYSE